MQNSGLTASSAKRKLPHTNIHIPTTTNIPKPIKNRVTTNIPKPIKNRVKNGMKNTGKYLYDKGKIPFNVHRRYLILNLIDRHKLMRLLKKIYNYSFEKKITSDEFVPSLFIRELQNITLLDILKKSTNGKVNLQKIVNIVSKHSNMNNNNNQGYVSKHSNMNNNNNNQGYVSKHSNMNNNNNQGNVEMYGSGKKPVKKAPAKKPAKKSTTKKSTTKKTT